MYNADGVIIYVGKSRALKNRVSSYFTGTPRDAKVAAMVPNIDRFEIIVTDTEFEALVLECSLIKQHQPRYNILLKDDKAYPYIRVSTNEAFPRIELARKVESDGAKYYGPYLNSYHVNETIGLLKTIYGVRGCNRRLPEDIGKERECLNYHIKRCTGPCNGHISQEDYRGMFDEIHNFLHGRTSSIIDDLKRDMARLAERMEFEKAAALRDRIHAIERLSEQQKIMSTRPDNTDVIVTANDGNTTVIYVMYIRDGVIRGKEQRFIDDNDVDTTELITSFIQQHYFPTNIPTNIHLEFPLPDEQLLERYLSELANASIHINVPQRGQKHDVLKLAKSNAIEALELRLISHDRRRRKSGAVLHELKTHLGTDVVPECIECYDVSHTGGTMTVGVGVCYVDGEPKKTRYRRYNLSGNDDYSNIKEMIYRRMENAMAGNEKFLPLPDVILMDGGIGQVNAALESLGFFNIDIPVFGIVKDDRHKMRGLVGTGGEITISRVKPAFALLNRISDEVHRYAISSHRIKRRNAITTELLSIKGVGEKKAAALLKAFGGVDKIKVATADALAAVKGMDKRTAAIVAEYYANQNNAAQCDVESDACDPCDPNS